MSRSSWFWACVVLALATLAAGLLVPVHLRAVDSGVLGRAGKRSPTLVEEGLGIAAGQSLGAAHLMLQAAKMERLPDAQRLDMSVGQLTTEHPDWVVWGGGDSDLARFFKATPANKSEYATEIIIQTANRTAGLKLLQTSSSAAVHELLSSRNLTNTVIFPPSASASGQPYDAAVVIGGLLLSELHFTPELSNQVFRLADAANHGGRSQPLEEVLLDLLALGQRFNWSQLSVFVSKIPDTDTLHLLAMDVRKADDQLPVLFSAVQLSGDPKGVANYLTEFSKTGMADLGQSLRFNEGGINELLQRKQRLQVTSPRESYAKGGPVGGFYDFAADYALRAPRAAEGVKWFLYLASGWLVAAALHFAKPVVSVLEEPLQVRGIHFAREFLFALGFLLTVLILSEPFLTQSDQKAPPLLRLQLPMPGKAIAAGLQSIKPSFMNQTNLSLMTVLVFFVLQGLLYLSCLIKLAEIRRQRVVPGMKLKLLENEEHLFDAGLYLGFAGTIVSLIFASLKVITFSLMAAYSCTAFGIIFVSIFKIFHLRPTRRTLLLEADALSRQYAAPIATHETVPQS